MASIQFRVAVVGGGVVEGAVRQRTADDVGAQRVGPLDAHQPIVFFHLRFPEVVLGLAEQESRVVRPAEELPDPDYEAAVGTANALAYRGRATIFIKSLQLDSSGQLPNLNFEMVQSGSATSPVIAPLSSSA